jgi:cell division protein FtsB
LLAKRLEARQGVNRERRLGDVHTVEEQERFSSLTGTLREGLWRRFKEIRQALRKAVPGTPRGEYLIWVLFVGLSLFFLWSALSGPHGALKFLKLKGSLEELEERNKVLLHQNQDLEKEVYLLRNSPDYLEKIAREEYGYIYPGETMYTIPGPDPAAGPESLEEQIGEEGPTPP